MVVPDVHLKLGRAAVKNLVDIPVFQEPPAKLHCTDQQSNIDYCRPAPPVRLSVAERTTKRILEEEHQKIKKAEEEASLQLQSSMLTDTSLLFNASDLEMGDSTADLVGNVLETSNMDVENAEPNKVCVTDAASKREVSVTHTPSDVEVLSHSEPTKSEKDGEIMSVLSDVNLEAGTATLQVVQNMEDGVQVVLSQSTVKLGVDNTSCTKKLAKLPSVTGTTDDATLPQHEDNPSENVTPEPTSEEKASEMSVTPEEKASEMSITPEEKASEMSVTPESATAEISTTPAQKLESLGRKLQMTILDAINTEVTPPTSSNPEEGTASAGAITAKSALEVMPTGEGDIDPAMKEQLVLTVTMPETPVDSQTSTAVTPVTPGNADENKSPSEEVVVTVTVEPVENTSAPATVHRSAEEVRLRALDGVADLTSSTSGASDGCSEKAEQSEEERDADDMPLR